MDKRSVLPIADIRGINGTSPTIEVENNNTTNYTLKITDVNGSFYTPNLKEGINSVQNNLQAQIDTLYSKISSNNFVIDTHFMCWEEGSSITVTSTSSQYAATTFKIKCSSSLVGTVVSTLPSRTYGLLITVGGLANGSDSDTFKLRACMDEQTQSYLRGKTVTLSWSVDSVLYSKTFTWHSDSHTSSTYEENDEIAIPQEKLVNGNTIIVDYIKLEIGNTATECFSRPWIAVHSDVLRFYERIYTDGILPHGFKDDTGSSYYCITYSMLKAKNPTCTGTVELLKNHGFGAHFNSPIGIDVDHRNTAYAVIRYIVPGDWDNGYHVKSSGTMIVDARM